MTAVIYWLLTWALGCPKWNEDLVLEHFDYKNNIIIDASHDTHSALGSRVLALKYFILDHPHHE